MGILSKIFKEYEDRIEALEDKVKFIEKHITVNVVDRRDLPIPAVVYEQGGKAKSVLVGGELSITEKGEVNIAAGKIIDSTMLSDNLPQLGSLSKKYESGRSGSGTVSSGKGDPGGVSYGTYQLASKTGTCARFIKTMKYVTYFRGTKPGTAAFSKRWKQLAKDSTQNSVDFSKADSFADAQHEFIKATHYDPLRKHADKKGMIDHHVVNQVLWSIGVQHGRAKSIVTKAGVWGTPEVTIDALYDAREAYVKRIKLPTNTRKSLLNRYKSERKEALAMV